MNVTRLIMGAVGVLALAAAGFGGFEVWVGGKSKDALAAANHRQEEMNARIATLETLSRAEAKRAQAVESDNATLRSAIAKAQTAKAAVAQDAGVMITHDMVEARYRQAKELARGGDREAALTELLWCLDRGMRVDSNYRAVRGSELLDEIANLGPAGITALRERRDKARQLLLASTNDTTAAAEFSSIARALKEDQSVVALYDEVPPGDRRRQSLANFGFNQLVAARRYSDAIVGQQAVTMISGLEILAQNPSGRLGNYAVATIATNIEVLAGAGDLAHAQTLMDHLLAYDRSEQTRAIVQQHLERAGHPELLPSPTPK
jgi:hypothetical protein